MELEVKIGLEDMGISYDAVKSLLGKIQEIEDKKGDIENLVLKLDVKEGQYSELSVAMIWRYAKECLNLKCNKELVSSPVGRSFLAKRHFFDGLTGNKVISVNPDVALHYESFSPIRATSSSQRGTEVNSIFSENIKSFLSQSKGFHKELRIQMLEVLNNAVDHSEYVTDAGAVCAKEKDKTLTFCVVDMGQGIKNSFLSNPALKARYAHESDETIIQMATGLRVSCNPTDNPHPNYFLKNGGIGLFFLKEFVSNHSNSALIIISGKGYYYIDGTGKETKRNFLTCSWPGTVVYLKTGLRDEKSSEYTEVCNHFLAESGLIDSDYFQVL